MSAAAEALRDLERATETRYPGRNGRWWYVSWTALRLCEKRHPFLRKRARPCDECRSAAESACDERDAGTALVGEGDMSAARSFRRCPPTARRGEDWNQAHRDPPQSTSSTAGTPARVGEQPNR